MRQCGHTKRGAVDELTQKWVALVGSLRRDSDNRALWEALKRWRPITVSGANRLWESDLFTIPI